MRLYLLYQTLNIIFSVVTAFHGYIIGTHMNKYPLLNNIMTMLNAFEAYSL
jgi:hypothetical protein